MLIYSPTLLTILYNSFFTTTLNVIAKDKKMLACLVTTNIKVFSDLGKNEAQHKIILYFQRYTILTILCYSVFTTTLNVTAKDKKCWHI